MGRRGMRCLRARVERECCISRGVARWARLNSGGIHAGGLRGGSHSVGSPEAAGTQQRGEAPGVRAAKSSESRKREK